MLKNKSIWQECANTVFQAENKDREEQAFQELQTDTEFDPDTEAELDKELEREPDRELMDDGKIEINDYYTRMIRSIPILSVEEELYWAKLAKDGKNEEERKLGKTKLIEHNMRYVLKIAHHFTSIGLTQDDIAQEGAMGLMMAAERFDYTKGYRFTTYATWWIRQKITRAIADQSRTIRIPVHLHESLGRLRKAEAQAKQQMLGAEEEMQFICEYTGFTREKVLELMAYRQDTVSLDTPIGNDDGDSDSTLGDFVPDSVGISPEEAAIRTNIHETIMDCMDSCLTDREREVVNYRFGLDGSKPLTLEEVGLIMHVTRERVRQIESKALKKMKNPKYKLQINLR